MQHRHRRKRRSEDFDWTIDWVQFDLCQAAVFIIRVENIAEDTAENFRGVLAGIQRNFASTSHACKTQRPNIIQTENVVGVPVGVDDGVDLADMLADGLFAEVGRSVDEHGVVRGPRQVPLLDLLG